MNSAATLAGHADTTRRFMSLVLELACESKRIPLACAFDGPSRAETVGHSGRAAANIGGQFKRGKDEPHQRLSSAQSAVLPREGERASP